MSMVGVVLICKQTNMALAVDRFELLANEIISVISSARDALAIIGILYAARKTVSVAIKVCTALKTYGLSSIGRTDLRLRYGQWAGQLVRVAP